MEEWKTYKIENLLLIPCRNGLTKPSKIRGNGVKMIGMGELFANTIISNIDMPRVPVSDKELVDSSIHINDLLFARQSLTLEGAGKCSIVKEVNEPTVFESHLIRLRINPTIADPWFVYYYFNSPNGKRQIANIVNQVAAAGIRGSELIKISIDLPSLETQKKITHCLKSLDNKIELNDRINHNLEQQARALYKSWFVDFVPFKDGKFVESELGMIPEGWTVVSFKDFLTPVSRKVPVGMYPEYSVTNNGIIPRSEKFKKQLSGNSSQNKQLRKYDIVFGMSREILNWGIMLDEIGSVSSAYNIYDINENVIHPLYLRYYMEQRSAYFNDLIGTAAREGQSLDKGALMQKYAIIPPGNALSSFMEREKTYRERIAANESETSSLESIRDSILPKLLCGELNINEIDC